MITARVANDITTVCYIRASVRENCFKRKLLEGSAVVFIEE